MARYIVRRLIYLMPLWLGLSLFAFALGALSPGDIAHDILRRRLAEAPTQEQVELFRAQLGLDRTIPIRYLNWVNDALRGDFGVSLWSGETVTTILLEALPTTVALTVLSMLLSIVVGVPLGIAAALRQGRGIDHISRMVALSGASLPTYWLGYILIGVFAVSLGVLPSQGTGSARHYLLPGLTLSLGATGLLMRLTRASMLDALGQEFLVAAKVRGLRRGRIIQQALRMAMNPILTSAGMILGFLLGGAVVVETVFAMPGVGKTLVDAANLRDLPVIQGFILYIGTLVLLLNICVDLLYIALDPRVRLMDN